MPLILIHELRVMPTLHSGHFSNVKINTGEMRVWVSRCTLADGELQPVQVERLIDGVWTDITEAENQQGSFNHIELDGGYASYSLYVITRHLQTKAKT